MQGMQACTRGGRAQSMTTNASYCTEVHGEGCVEYTRFNVQLWSADCTERSRLGMPLFKRL